MTETLPATRAPGRESEVLDLSSDAVDRLFARAPLPPWGVGAAVFLGLVSLYLAATAATGELAEFLARGGDLVNDRNARLGVILPVLVAYVPTAQRILALSSRRNLAALERATGTPTPQLEAPGSKGLVMGALMLGVPLTAFLVDRDTMLYFESGYWGIATLSNWVIGGIFSAALGRFAH